jgi:hypothetical protein
METWVWLSAAVEKTWDFLVGMVVLRWISLVMTPPRVSIPRERGVTSNNNISLTSPVNTAPYIAAPIATASSGLTPLLGFLLKNALTISYILGILVIPPTSNTSSILSLLSPESFKQASKGANVFLVNSSTNVSYLARVNVTYKCLGPVLSALKYGKLISV